MLVAVPLLLWTALGAQAVGDVPRADEHDHRLQRQRHGGERKRQAHPHAHDAFLVCRPLGGVVRRERHPGPAFVLAQLDLKTLLAEDESLKPWERIKLMTGEEE